MNPKKTTARLAPPLLALAATAAAVLATLLPQPAALGYACQAGDDGTDTPLCLYWDEMPVHYYINEQTSDALPNIADGSRPVEAIHRSFQKWREISISRLDFEYLGTTSITGVANDNRNVVSFVDHDYAFNGRLAVGHYWYYTSTGEMADSDIVFNPDEDWYTQGDHPDHFDIEALLTHEIGHFIGVTHTGIMSSSMYPYTGPERINHRLLSPDEHSTAAATYSAPPLAAERGTISGRVRRSGYATFGAHVVAVDKETGTPIASALSYKDGTYRIEGLPPGVYNVVTEPCDRPLQQGNFTTAYWQSEPFVADFPTTFYGGNSFPNDVTVFAGSNTANIDLDLPTTSAGVNVRLIGRYPRSGGSVTLTNITAELPQGSTDEWNFMVAGEGLVEPSTFEILGPGLTRATGFGYGNLGDGTPYVAAGFDCAADAPATPRVIKVTDPWGNITLLVGGLEVMPNPARLTVVKDPLDPEALYLSWYGGFAPYDLVRDTDPTMPAPAPIYSEIDLSYSDPVLGDGHTYFYLVNP